MNPVPCEVCGQAKRLLFTNYACFNERCGEEVASANEALAAWTKLFGAWLLGVPDDIDVVRCEPVATADAYDVVYKLKGVEWYGAQYVPADQVRQRAYEAREVWAYMRKGPSPAFAPSSWGVP